MNNLQKELANFTKNLRLFIEGFGLLDELQYKPNWDKWKFLPLYIFDYGTRVAVGGAIVSWSRWFYLNRKTNRFAAFMNRGLNHLDMRHGELAGRPLWLTVDCAWWLQAALWAVYAAIAGLILA